jgi:hypothetical protein
MRRDNPAWRRGGESPTPKAWRTTVLDADIRGFFDAIDHG